MDYSLLWRVKGYTGIELTKEKINSNKYFFDEILESDTKIIKQVETKLEKGGVVFALAKKKVIKAIYILKLTTVDGEKVLIFDKKVVLPEVLKCVDEFEEDINGILNEVIFHRHDIDKAVWKEKDIDKTKRFKAAMTEIKLFAWLGTILLGIIALALVVCGTLHSLTGISAESMDEIKKDELIISYVSDINHYRYSETTVVVSEFTNNNGFVVTQIVVPTVIQLAGYILLILSLQDVLDLTKGATDNKSFFTEDKNQQLKKAILKAFCGLLFVLGNFVLWLGIGSIICVIQYMFSYCVYFTTNKK